MKTKDIIISLAKVLSMSVDYFGDCHYGIISVVLFLEHALVLMAAIAAFVSAYRASRLRPAIRRSRRRDSVRPPLAVPEA